ncbi:MAG: hypothetical protein AAFV19_19115 [Pseudomonadota bacterium]
MPSATQSPALEPTPRPCLLDALCASDSGMAIIEPYGGGEDTAPPDPGMAHDPMPVIDLDAVRDVPSANYRWCPHQVTGAHAEAAQHVSASCG